MKEDGDHMETEEECRKSASTWGTSVQRQRYQPYYISNTLGDSTKKVNKDGKRIARPQGHSVSITVDGSKILQWDGMLLITCGNNH